jgi:hypothetical protein
LRAIFTRIYIGIFTLMLAGAAWAQQGATERAPDPRTYDAQSQGNQIGTIPENAPASNPGFGEQVPNDHNQPGGRPELNSTYQKDRNGNAGFDLGWLGLLGLAGLFGLGRGNQRRVMPEDSPQIRR